VGSVRHPACQAHRCACDHHSKRGQPHLRAWPWCR
jgi:hypothetical protein